jgi:hypothetical protein
MIVAHRYMRGLIEHLEHWRRARCDDEDGLIWATIQLGLLHNARRRPRHPRVAPRAATRRARSVARCRASGTCTSSGEASVCQQRTRRHSDGLESPTYAVPHRMLLSTAARAAAGVLPGVLTGALPGVKQRTVNTRPRVCRHPTRRLRRRRSAEVRYVPRGGSTPPKHQALRKPVGRGWAAEGRETTTTNDNR